MRVKHKHELFFTDDEIVARGVKISPRGARPRWRRRCERPTLLIGGTVRFKHDDDDWRQAKVTKVLPHRSYELMLSDGSTRRRTSQHIRTTREPFTEPIRDGVDDSPLPPQPTVPTTAMTRTDHTQPTSQQPYVTRSGQTVNMPARYKY